MKHEYRSISIKQMERSYSLAKAFFSFKSIFLSACTRSAVLVAGNGRRLWRYPIYEIRTISLIEKKLEPPVLSDEWKWLRDNLCRRANWCKPMRWFANWSMRATQPQIRSHEHISLAGSMSRNSWSSDDGNVCRQRYGETIRGFRQIPHAAKSKSYVARGCT